MNRLLLVRHGQSTANRDHLVLGRSPEVGLTELGRAQARQAAERISGLVDGPVAVVCSTARRARQTAAVVAERLGIRAEPSDLLVEQCLGELEGRPTAELRAESVPDGLDITEVCWGGGESVEQVHARMREFLGELAARADLPRTVVLVGHSDAFCVLQAVLAGRGHRDIDWDADHLALGQVRELGWRPSRFA